jgi:nitrite reductase/ring-hydroxylating ferredoxin subunit
MEKGIQLTKNLEHLKILMDDEFTLICSIGELKENVGRKFIVGDIEIALFKISNKVFALSNICPHQQTHLIYDGFIENEFVVCPAHGWKFNLRTGKKDSGSNGLQIFPVEVIDGNIFVKVKSKEMKW